VPIVVKSHCRDRDIAVGKRLADNSACRSLGFRSILLLSLLQFVSTSFKLFLSFLSLGRGSLVLLGRALSARLLLEGDIQHTNIAANVSIFNTSCKW
jgi:hypothetical protein